MTRAEVYFLACAAYIFIVYARRSDGEMGNTEVPVTFFLIRFHRVRLPWPPPSIAVQDDPAIAYVIMVHIVMGCVVVADIVMAYVVIGCIVMAYVVMAYIVMAYIVMAYIVVAYIVMANVVVAYIVMAAPRIQTLPPDTMMTNIVR